MTISFAKQAQSASREMAIMSKAIEADLKPMAAEFRKMQSEALKATEALQKRTLSDARAAEALRKTYDTGYANAAKYLQVEEQVQTQIAKRNLTVEQGSAIMAGATARFKQMGDSTKTANDNVKLTAGQVQNLGYQLNDTATMLAMGASPFQIMASQAGQVVQALGDGPGGVKGSLAAIGASIASFATKTNLIVGGLAAAAGAAVYFATRSDSSIKTAEEALAGYKKLVDSLGDSYARAGDAAERYMARNRKEGPDVALAAIQGTTSELMASLQQEIEALVPKTQNIMDESIRSFAQLTPEVLKSQDAIRSLGQQLDRGDITAAQFREEMAKIRIDPKTPPEIVKIADKLLAGSLNARDLALALGAVGEAAAAASGKMGRLIVPSSQDMTAPFGGTIEMLKRLRPEEFSGLVDGLQDQARALEDTKNKSNEYGEAMTSLRQSLSGSIDDLQLQVDTFGQSAGAIAKAKFAADALRDAQDAATDAGRASIDPQIVAFIEKQADEYGRLTDQLNTATEAQRAQAKAAEDVKRQQERVREFAADLEFERSIATLPDAEQQVRETLRGLGVEYDSFEGQRLAAGMRYNEALRETQDEMESTRDAAADFVSTLVDGLSSGKGALDTLISAFAGLGKQMASAGLDKLMNGLFGTGGGNGGQTSGIGGLASAFTGLTQAITKPPTASQVFGGGSTFSAPTVPVERGGALQALTAAAPAAAAAAG